MGRVRGWLVLAAAALLGAAGCRTGLTPGPSAGTSSAVRAQRVYASYSFDPSPNVLNFGVQPLWIPTCVIWEVMARDLRLQSDLRRLDCRLDAHAFFKGRDMNAYMRSGRLQGGMVGDLPALKAASQFDVRIVSLIQQGPCSLIAREPMTVEQLRGRAIGYAPGSNAHYTLVQILRKHDLRPADVRLVPMDVIDMADALASRRIDAFSAWEPTPTLAILNHPSFEVLARSEARGYLYFNRAYMARKPGVVRAVIAAEIRALQWLRRNDKNLYIASRWARDRAGTFAGSDLPLTGYDFLRLARRDVLRVPTAPRLLPQLLAPAPTAWIPGEVPQQFRMSREWGLIEPDSDWERVRRSFALELVPSLLADAATYHLDDLRLGMAIPMSGQPSTVLPGSF
jgi:ABC-type nitrate/sulfonate/bicarbonate transport system substrate-binding protein